MHTGPEFDSDKRERIRDAIETLASLRSRLLISDKLSVNSKAAFFAHEVCGPVILNSEENAAWNRVDAHSKTNDRSGPGYGF